MDIDLEYLSFTYDTRKFYLENIYPYYEKILLDDEWCSDTT